MRHDVHETERRIGLCRKMEHAKRAWLLAREPANVERHIGDSVNQRVSGNFYQMGADYQRQHTRTVNSGMPGRAEKSGNSPKRLKVENGRSDDGKQDLCRAIAIIASSIGNLTLYA